jgi:hypothetical protein
MNEQNEITSQKTILPPIIITVKIGGVVEQRNLSDDLSVSEDHINEYLIRSPALTAYWNMLHEKQRSIVQRTEVAVKRKRGEIAKRQRELRRSDNEKISVSEIESLIDCDPDFQEIENQYLDLCDNERLLKGAVDSIKELRSILISLSANMRQSGHIKIKDPETKFREKFGRSSQSQS